MDLNSQEIFFRMLNMKMELGYSQQGLEFWVGIFIF